MTLNITKWGKVFILIGVLCLVLAGAMFVFDKNVSAEQHYLVFNDEVRQVTDDGDVYYLTKSGSQKNDVPDELAELRGRNAYIYITTGSGSDSFSVKSVEYSQNDSGKRDVRVQIRESCSEIGTCDMAYWTIRIPLKHRADNLYFDIEG